MPSNSIRWHGRRIMSLILDTLTLILAALLSLVFRRRITVHKVSVDKVTHSGIHSIRYSSILPGDVRYDLTISRMSFHFHFPSKSRPSWLIINAEDIFYKSDSCDLLVGAWLITCWFFPRLLRQTAGPWFNAEVDDVRIRIMRSNNIPHYVQLLRANVVEVVLTGEILRVDDFATTVRVDGLSESAVEQSEDVNNTMPDGGPYSDHLTGKDGSVQGSLTDSDGDMKAISNRRNRECAEPFHSKEQDEMRISVHAETVHINNRMGRYYSFGSIDAQHRRNWTANRGTFVLIVEEARWIKTPMPYEMVARASWPIQLFAAVCHFPFDIWRLATHPTAMANIYVPRADITFDNFRMRDAEIVVQGISLVRENMAAGDKRWNDIFADGIANLALGMLRSY